MTGATAGVGFGIVLGGEPMLDQRAEIIEGLNVFRALECWGATLYAAWAAREADARLRAGHLIIA